MPRQAMMDVPGGGTDANEKFIQTLMVITSVLSMTGCVFIITSYMWKQYTHDKRDFTAKMVLVMSIIDFLDAGFKLFGTLGYTRPWLCNVQGFVMNAAGVSGVTWLACMAFTWYRWIVRRDDDQRLHRWFRTFCVVSFVPSAVESLYLVAADKYGPAGFYCWIGDAYGTSRIYFFFTWVFAAAAGIMTLAFLVGLDVYKRQKSQDNQEAARASSLIFSKLSAYVGIFVVVWGPCIVNRLVQFFRGESIYELFVVHISFNNSQGLLNAIVYGGVVQAVRRLVFGVDTRGSGTRMTNNCSELSTSFIRDDVPGVTISVFATTFNLGEGNAPDDMAQWIPLGHDVYVIGVQECLHLTELRAAVKGFLERCTHTTFAEYSRDIGSKNTVLGYHGFIGIAVFVPETDVDNGNFYMPTPSTSEVNCGKTLNFRTSNKGGVGFAFRYLDTSIAVVSCHLSSDSKGKSNMERRNEDATLIWQSLHLSGDAMGVEFPSLHHHTIVMGDLNYRLTRFHASPHEVVDLVAHALSQKKWPLQQRLSAQSPPDSSGMTILSSFPPVPQLPLAGSPSSVSSSHHHLSSTPPDRRTRFHRRTVGAWTPVLKHDELLMCMEDGLAFAGFDEAVITFPPTFRRLRHTSLLTSCDVASAYSLEAANGGGPRVPSYTDRILYHSLADVEGDLECTEYRCHESIDVSDHKPVSCVFHITTKAHRFPLPSPPPPHALDGTAMVEEDDRVRDVVLEVPDDGDRHWLDRASMTGVQGVRECIIVLNQLRWMPTKKPSDVRRGSSDDILSQKWDDPKQYADIELCTLFPLPLEDIFAEQRKLHQLAASWRMGLVGGSSADGRSKYLNHMRVPWMSVREKGVVHRCFAQAKRHMHIALDIRGPTMSLGQCALSLDAAFVKLNVHMPFEEALSTGGIKAGVLKGRVMFCMV
ncbi:hypothetical protein H257_05900 [Aphanomyces astaci]|uniref:Inositol polyphosphate-related phosphatase domain-containing protein n=1 Tax=Aphanomyces astaci TaxID=112090 RepID=W4GNR8_APHAT|nr:hypothetical protein H257_05900 [Aphanomyces astaci]ETV81357.1 hypothetical protein H257_05900 [Aphanomyces astaci]|eukprot:XP_009829215.1 hypothetical protein H257_05900 [Aphanomyces astaci]